MNDRRRTFHVAHELADFVMQTLLYSVRTAAENDSSLDGDDLLNTTRAVTYFILEAHREAHPPTKRAYDELAGSGRLDNVVARMRQTMVAARERVDADRRGMKA